MQPEDKSPVTGTNPIVRGSKVWLRALERSDLDAYKASINDAELAYWAGYVAPQGMDKVLDWYENIVRPQHGKDGYFFSISPLGSSEFIGMICLWNLNGRIAGGEVSLFIADKKRWGTGVGTDAVNALVDFGFGFTSIQRIWLFTSAENERAKRSYEKSGFVLEGKIRGNQIRRGKVLDSFMMSMLRSDWEALDRKRSWEYEVHNS